MNPLLRASPSPSFVALAALLILSACNGGRPRPIGGDGGSTGGPCTAGSIRCDGLSLQDCQDGAWANAEQCAGACDPILGCVACTPGGRLCEGDVVRACSPIGEPGAAIVTCAAGQCVNGTCTDPCGRAGAEFSYIGCDYWPTVTANIVDPSAHFAVAVANPNDQPAEVQVVRAGVMKTETVPPNGLSTIQLDWVPELKSPGGSTLVKGGAYRLSASLPVTVYQFSPLEFQVMPCGAMASCPTYTNDASLLLPQHTLTQNYMVISRPTFMFVDKDLISTDYRGKSAGLFAVVGTEAGPTTVTIKFKAPTMAGAGGVKAYPKGAVATFTLEQQDVLQIFSNIPSSCTPTRVVKDPPFGEQGFCELKETDLTGTEISADKKIAVFGGHECTFVPYDTWACDHLEEQMLPLEGWGKKYVVTKVQRTPADIPDLVRVVSATDGNTITFTPNVSGPITINRGEWREFQVKGDFVAEGTGAFAVAQFMVGQDFGGNTSGGPGDPAMSLAVPVEQYRSSYIFLAPDTYTENYVNVTAAAGAEVTLDGTAIPAASFAPVGGGEFVAARVKLAAGTHSITSGAPFGIASYGVAPYTSYMYPGGLDVKQINIQ